MMCIFYRYKTLDQKISSNTKIFNIGIRKGDAKSPFYVIVKLG